MTGSAVTGSCELVWAEGPDAESFLQGLLTNDVAALEIRDTCPSLLLDASGHVRSAMRVFRDAADAFTLICPPGQGDRLAGLLDEYHFSESVEIIGPEPSELVTFLDGPPPSDLPGADLVLPGLVPATVDAIGANAAAIASAAGAATAPAAELERRRIEAGVPLFEVDYTDANLVQEAGLDRDHVSFDKGCYLGQETVARVHYRGQVNRRLVGLRLPGPVPPGVEVQANGRNVGTITSAARSTEHGYIGLAIVRREVPTGAAVAVAGIERPATLSALPFTKS